MTNEKVDRRSALRKKLSYFCWILFFMLISLLVGLYMYHSLGFAR